MVRDKAVNTRWESIMLEADTMFNNVIVILIIGVIVSILYVIYKGLFE